MPWLTTRTEISPLAGGKRRMSLSKSGMVTRQTGSIATYDSSHVISEWQVIVFLHFCNTITLFTCRTCWNVSYFNRQKCLPKILPDTLPKVNFGGSFLWSFLILLTSDSRGFLTTSYIWKGFEIRSGCFRAQRVATDQRQLWSLKTLFVIYLLVLFQSSSNALTVLSFAKRVFFRAGTLQLNNGKLIGCLISATRSARLGTRLVLNATGKV